MGLETSHPDQTGQERNVGNIYARLNAARRQRERVLETPLPANVDPGNAVVKRAMKRPFPTLKPPAREMPDIAGERKLDWTIPWLIGFVIFAIIFGFAVG